MLLSKKQNEHAVVNENNKAGHPRIAAGLFIEGNYILCTESYLKRPRQ